MSYLSDRLTALHISEEMNSWTVVDDGHTIHFRFFTEDKNGDIQINYLTPEGYVEEYENTETNRRGAKPFFRIRLQHPKEGQGKYQQPKGTGTPPFCTPAILRAYKEKAKLRTLYVTEGEFKAFALSNFNVPCLGIGGIQNYKGKNKEIHPYILDIIQRCQVENIVLLFDADCNQVEWEEDKDLMKRPLNFYTALNTFNELLKPHDLQLYFAHVAEEANYKGIDDLLYSGQCSQEDVIYELTSLLEHSNERHYILTYQISGISSYKIKSIFGLNNAKEFFDLHKNILANREFRYGNNYYFADESDKVTASWRGEQKNYIRIGIDYYKKVVEKSHNGQTEINIKKWSASIIKADYNKSAEFLKLITKCDSFTNIPDNNPATYQQIVISEKDGITSRLYNMYCPVKHIPTQGDWKTINKLIHHIFDYKNNAGDSLYEFALDYLQILYSQPSQKLPIICLISKERGTGKSTFLDLLRAIFVENMRILDSERISSKFNGAWAGKLIVAVDESLIDTDKPTVLNRIKMIATNTTIPFEEKGCEAREVPNFSKLIMCSNDENNFIKMEAEENRYCIIKVPVIDGKKNPHLLDIMKGEIPAFLYFLQHRQLYYPEGGRLYFEESIFRTPALSHIIERTETKLVKNIKYVLKDQFFWMKREIIYLPLSVIYDRVSIQYKFAEKTAIAEYLRDQGLRTGNARKYYYRTYSADDPGQSGKDRCYKFVAQTWLTPEDYAELLAINPDKSDMEE